MKRRMSWLLVFGLVLSIMLAVVGWTTVSVQAQTKPVEQAWTQPSVLQAQLPAASTQPEKQEPVIRQTSGGDPGDFSLCITCGGQFPIFAGAFTAASSSTSERGSSCSGDVTSRTDSRPFLCTN